MKKAVLAVSFGTADPDALEKGIAAVEADLAAALPDRTLRRAFTGGEVIRRLWERESLEIDTAAQALERLGREGFSDVVVQPVYVSRGGGYERLRALAALYEGVFPRLALGAPLLSSPRDFREAAEALLARLPDQSPGQAVALMGHRGTGAACAALEGALWNAGRRDTAVGAEGALEAVCRRLGQMGGVRQVVCLPLLVAAGYHAKRGLAGQGGASWSAGLAARGYRVRCVLEGLGENPAIRSIFVRHAKEAAEEPWKSLGKEAVP